ncbi:hypothetical protein FV222_06255 [Methylobacterium sp. WL103]|uniref:hypothetical protein n=1 Tax=Methylobacterium sp. WL103 TaxID=2603891 RepID=UPI0011C89E6D|nr:hypothetical protein [Methylobacterium sp. WL103]TXN05806.1 hypothetical protein FV222_06255 [Methylobacterium sp. WL103]
MPDDYSLVSRGDLNLKPTEAAQQAYFQARGRQAISLDQQNAINAGLGHIDVSEGLGFPGYATSPDGRTAYYEMPDTDGAPKRPVGTDVLASIGSGVASGLDGARDIIGQTYSDVLNRLPNADEIQTRLDSLSSGASNLYDQIAGIAGSAEAKEVQQQTGFDPMRYVADQTYQQVLGRGASDTDITSALSVLQNGGSLSSLAAGLAGSQEGQTYQLNDFYQNAFGRQADSPGLQNALSQLKAGVPIQQLETMLLQSPEAQERVITPDQFASILTPNYLSPVPTGNPIQTPAPITGDFSGGTPLQTVPTGNPIATPDPIAADFSGSPLSPVATGNPIATPDPISASFGQPLAPVPTGPNVSQGVRPGDFHGSFDAAAYLQANPDVAAAHADPLQHYLTYGFQEGRTIDPQGDRISQGFNPSQYLAANPDVAAAGMNPLQHYLQYGAHEGRSTDFSGGGAPGNFGAGIYQPAGIDALGLGSVASPTPISGDFSGSPLSPVDAGNPIAAPPSINADFGSPLTPVPTGPNVSAGVGPGSFHGTFNAADYLAANPDVAAQHVDPLQHYLTYGFNEGRALDTAGDRIGQGFNPSQYLAANPDIAASGMTPLQHYIQYGAHEGRAADFSGNASLGSFGAGITPYSPAPGATDFSGANVSQGIQPASFHGRFDGAAYDAANPDVAASGMDPLTHYLTYGFKEGRALDTQGDRINQGFDAAAYLRANPDVAADHQDPLAHYLRSGAAEGRALPTGSNPYQFSNFNVAQGAGPTGNGSFGFGGMGAPPPPAPALPDFGAGTNVSGGLGATAQSFGSLFPAGNGQPAGSVDPYAFSSANVGGYNPNAGGSGGSSGGGVEDFAAGTKDFNLSPGFEPTASEDFSSGQGDYSGEYGGGGFNPQASEMAFLRGQLDQQYAANARLAASNDTNIAFANQGAAQAAQLNAVGAGNAANQFAGIQAGLGIAPVVGSSFFAPPVTIPTIGGIGPMNFGLAGLGGAPLRGFL